MIDLFRRLVDCHGVGQNCLNEFVSQGRLRRQQIDSGRRFMDTIFECLLYSW